MTCMYYMLILPTMYPYICLYPVCHDRAYGHICPPLSERPSVSLIEQLSTARAGVKEKAR